MEPGIITTNVIGATLLAASGLAVAAWWYDRWIERLEAAGHHHGYVALLVVAGCAVILLTALLVCWPLGSTARIAVAITTGLFAPAGLPMIIGSIHRHVVARRHAEERATAAARETLR